MGNAAKAPSGGALGNIGTLFNIAEVGLDNGVLLDVFNLPKSVLLLSHQFDENVHPEAS
jgi:hypothetical protein